MKKIIISGTSVRFFKNNLTKTRQKPALVDMLQLHFFGSGRVLVNFQAIKNQEIFDSKQNNSKDLHQGELSRRPLDKSLENIPFGKKNIPFGKKTSPLENIYFGHKILTTFRKNPPTPLLHVGST